MRRLAAVLGFVALNAAAAVSTTEVDAALGAKDFKQAERLAQTWAKEAPKDPVPWIKLSIALQGQAKYPAALAALEKARERKAQPMWLLMREARIRSVSGDIDGAVATLTTAAKNGFANLAMLESDAEFVKVRADARWAALKAQVDKNANPCAYQPESKQFDFWVGDWTVTVSGSPVGESRVEKILNGCVLLENWTSAGGGSGKSFNLYDPEQKRWRQTWVNSGGQITDYAGGLDAKGNLVFTAHDLMPQGMTHLRMTFTRLSENQVRQFIETSADEKTWSPSFDGLYTRKQ